MSSMFGSFEIDETVEAGKRGRKPVEINPESRAAWDAVIKAAQWDRYFSTVITKEKDAPHRTAEILAGVLARDLSKLRKETVDENGMPLYRLSVLQDKDAKTGNIKFSFRVYPVNTPE